MIKNGVSPSARMRPVRRFFTPLSPRRMITRPPHRKRSTKPHDTIWEITVASAAPFTPMEQPNIRIGSRTILMAAPTATEAMPTLAKPWQMIN